MATNLMEPGDRPANPPALAHLPGTPTAAEIWTEACRDKAAVARNPRGFVRLAKMLSAFERNDIELAVDMLIEAFDRIDGDSDVEPNGDEGIDFLNRIVAGRPEACEYRTEDDEIGESETDVAWRENINQTAPQFRHVYVNELTGEAIGTPEDAEHDDDDSGIEDGPHDPLSPAIFGSTGYGDREGDDAYGAVVPSYGVDQTMPPMPEPLATATLFVANAS